VQAIQDISTSEASCLKGLLFDLDDTLLDHGQLTEPAFSSLFRLREAGLDLIAVTGRPGGWGVVIARLFPVSAVVAENGAIACVREGHLVRRVDSVGEAERRARRIKVASLVAEMRSAIPELTPADDVDARFCDFAFDIGERRHVPRELVDRAVDMARSRGARTTLSSVHLHVSFDGEDKASGAVAMIRTLTSLDPTLCRIQYAFIGDSENDAACFGAFRTTIGVANLRGRITVPPRFKTTGARGAGFAEAAQVLIAKRTRA
jgi:hypothetical protein